jgi:hypothetical protein
MADNVPEFDRLAALFEQHAELTAAIHDKHMQQRALSIERDNARMERRQALEACLRNGDRAAYGRLKSAERRPEPSEPQSEHASIVNDLAEQLQELSRIQTEIDELLSSEGFQH